MHQPPSFFQHHTPELQLAARAALAAGDVIIAGYQQAHTIDAKGVGDLVSQVDFDADNVATTTLRQGSSYPILSEELNPTSDDIDQDMWIVDPLDGTTAYLMQAGPQFSSVLIALQADGDIQLGIVYFPLTNEWFYAQRGVGAYCNGELLQLPQRDWDLSETWVEMNQYGNSDFETPFFAATRVVLRSTGGAQIVTSTFPHAGVAMRIAQQKNGLALAIHDNNPRSLKQGPWDIAANQVIFEESGGVFLNPDGKRTSPFVAEPILIAPTRDLAEQVLRLSTATAE